MRESERVFVLVEENLINFIGPDPPKQIQYNCLLATYTAIPKVCVFVSVRAHVFFFGCLCVCASVYGCMFVFVCACVCVSVCLPDSVCLFS